MPTAIPDRVKLVGSRGDDRPGNAEVQQHRTFTGEHDIGGLHVAVDDAMPVGVVQGVQHVAGDSQRLRDRQGSLDIHPFPQRRPLDEAHDVVDQPLPLPGVENLRDVGIVQLGGDLDLAEEAVGRHADQQLRVQDLEGYRLATRVPGQEYSGIPAPADLTIDLVHTGEGLAHQRQHVAPDEPSIEGMNQWLPTSFRFASGEGVAYRKMSLRMPRRMLHQSAPQRLESLTVTAALPVIPGRQPAWAGRRNRTSTA